MDDFFGIIKDEDDALARSWLMEDDKNLLHTELYIAELQARKGGKRKTRDAHAFEVNLYDNLIRLRDAIWDMGYTPYPGTAHIIFRPVQREIFAAPYPDRVVQHWVVDQIDRWWDHRLIYDSYSCRVGKGTKFGIERLRHHILSVMLSNPGKRVYVLKLDITGYFMHIQRELMLNRVLWGLDKQFEGNKGQRYKILKHAITEIVMDDPTEGVRIEGSYEDWRGLPEDKSLFFQPEGQGMVIGNLVSQDFSNIYLDVLDRFVTLTLGYKHYGRYVDDFYIVVTEDELPQLRRDIKATDAFLNGIGLSLNKKKTRIIPVEDGVPFLGMVVKKEAIIPGKRIKSNFMNSAYKLVNGDGSVESIASYLGLLKHANSDKMVSRMFERVGWEYNL